MTLQIFEQRYPVPRGSNKFRLVEVYASCDGPRMRVSDRSFPTLEAAEDFVDSHRPECNREDT